MLSKGEAAALLSLRNSHHGNAQWDDLQLDAFRSELNPASARTRRGSDATLLCLGP